MAFSATYFVPTFLFITQRVMVISYRHFGTAYRYHPRSSTPLNPEDVADSFSRNVGKKLPLLEA
jgi:hypothetical protein